MGQGRILAEGEPARLTAALAGRLWATLVPRDAVAVLRQRHQVLSCRVKSGNMEVRVLASQCPVRMEPAQPSLEDVYFATLQQHGLAGNLE
jgi:ABC-2 type transport system ATP-binding protein